MKTMTFFVVLAATSAWATSDAASVPTSPNAYQSVFADYKPLQDEPLNDWRHANDEMGRLRGHIGHLGSNHSTTQSGHDHGKPAKPRVDGRSEP